MSQERQNAEKRENMWLNLGFNIAIPSIFLIKGKWIFESLFGSCDNPESLNFWIFIFALAFPIAYGAWDLARRRKCNIISILGIVSVLLTGGIGLLQLSKNVMIIKEGLVPLLIGVAVLATAPTKRPLAKVLLMNESVVNIRKVDEAIDEKGTRAEFEKALRLATYIVASSFVLSSILNFALAYFIFKSPSGTEAFNAEVGRMTALSFPVIALPATVIMVVALYKLFGAITRCTGLALEDIMASPAKK